MSWVWWNEVELVGFRVGCGKGRGKGSSLVGVREEGRRVGRRGKVSC